MGAAGRLHRRRGRIAQPQPFPDPGGPAQVVLPRVPLRLVRDPGRGAAQLRRTDLRQLRERLRPDQPADRDGPADVFPVRPERGRQRLERRPDLGRLPQPVNGNGFELKEGPVIDKTVLKFRSFVHAPMRHGKLFLAGDAAHTVPPTGAKGLNLALHDVKVLFEGLDSFYRTGNAALLDAYSEAALDRVWK